MLPQEKKCSTTPKTARDETEKRTGLSRAACMHKKENFKSPEPGMPKPWRLRNGNEDTRNDNPPKDTFVLIQIAIHYRITAENIHALVGYGSHGKQELIRDLKCQACRKKFISRRNTILYRLKTHASRGLVEKILWILALGVNASALEEVFSVREITIRTWLSRSGMQDKKLHEHFILELDLIHVQLDELWANVKHLAQDMWVWVACDFTTKIIPVLQVGGRTQEMAFHIVHELKGRLQPGCVPVFRTDGLRHYFYALTAHFGRWEKSEGKRSVWILLSDFVYAQVIKHQKRRRTVQVERRNL